MNIQATSNTSEDRAGTRPAQANTLYNALAESFRVENSGASGRGVLGQSGGQLGGMIPNMTELYRQASLSTMNSLVESAAAQANGTVSCVHLPETHMMRNKVPRPGCTHGWGGGWFSRYLL